MRLGIFGGTFNPVHYGHLINAELIRWSFSLDRVLFVPSKHPVHKELEGEVPSLDRIKMIELALKGNDYMEVSSIEIEKDTPSYTIYTVNELEKIYSGSSLFLIIGSDSYYEIDTWKNYRELVEKVSLIVMQREVPEKVKKSPPGITGDILFADNPLVGISSTIIRNRVRGNLGIRYLLPDEVIDYIYKKGFYRN